ncbi:HlyD family secretion protein [Fundidesulfovibrio soli]|uniref:HlyD family secretion protein n=1 Tax=Fundidesulfovibrio soli TaxID=2922716 RepID=UPI001FAF45E7|nr:HlyD family efflux transporter periplasmic adaptor subunit [Fundidesulfovibrio soli]
MKRLILALAAATALCWGCSKGAEGVYQGYVEGEFVYVASPYGGRLDELAAQRGASVRAGEALFVLEHELESQGVNRAQANLKRAQDTLEDLKKGLRPQEIDQILARIAQSEADLALARLELDRRRNLLATGAVAKEDYDRADTAYQTAKGRLDDYRAQLATGKLGSRIDQILAAQAQVKAAQADLEQAKWSLGQKFQNAPRDALVFDLLHYRGEWVQAGSPVVKLLPPDAIKVRFFIPEQSLGAVRLGQKVTVSCDGCSKPFEGAVSFVFPQAEYAPPVIYSQDFRSKLVYMVEARFDPETARLLKPGQPVDVRLAPANPGGGA